MLKAINLKKYYGNFLAVDNVSFELNEGEALGLIGLNGAGKSTTIKMLIGLINPTHGNVFIDNEKMDLNNINLKHKIGYMPEESSLYEDIDAYSFLEFFSEIYEIPKVIAKERITSLLNDLHLENKIISSMSKGMKRKLLIARSLLSSPTILVYDEPASGIDPETTAFILDYILELKKKGKIIILTGHNLNHVEKISDKIIMLKKGKIVFNDTINHIRQEKKYILRYKKNGNVKEMIFDDVKEINTILNKIINEGDTIIDFKEKEQSLEEIFLDIAKK